MGDFTKIDATIERFLTDYNRLIQRKIEIILTESSRPSKVMFLERKLIDSSPWVRENHERFLEGTRNKMISTIPYPSEYGYVTAMAFDPPGEHIVVAYSSGMVQVRNGHTGEEMRTLRYIEFPHKPIYALVFDPKEQRICYAACTNGNVYKITVPKNYLLRHDLSSQRKHTIYAQENFWIHAKTVEFQERPSSSGEVMQFISYRRDILCLDITHDSSNMMIGTADSFLRIYDMKSRRLIKSYGGGIFNERVHSGYICSLRSHPGNSALLVTGGWDRTMRVWDIRCKTGCVATFEGVNVCADSIDVNDRDLVVCGSWQPVDALSLFDLRERLCLSRGRIQNRQRDTHGEYLYACRYWNSSLYNRKGKYALTGGSGTNALEVVNLHNRYIACSYPAAGSILAVASHEERIAYAGTAPFFNIAEFHDPKHEKLGDTDDSYNDTGDGESLEDDDGVLMNEEEQLQDELNERCGECYCDISNGELVSEDGLDGNEKFHSV